MVETGHISHYGFLIWTSSVHNVYEGGEDRGYEDTHIQAGQRTCDYTQQDTRVGSDIIQAGKHRHTFNKLLSLFPAGQDDGRHDAQATHSDETEDITNTQGSDTHFSSLPPSSKLQKSSQLKVFVGVVFLSIVKNILTF